jgi:hypothetical protein
MVGNEFMDSFLCRSFKVEVRTPLLSDGWVYGTTLLTTTGPVTTEWTAPPSEQVFATRESAIEAGAEIAMLCIDKHTETSS